MRRILSSPAEFRILLSSPAYFADALPPTQATPKCDAQKCPWWPYSSAKEFKANTASVIVILLCALICGLAINSAIRYVVEVHKRRRRQSEAAEEEKEEPEGGSEDVEAGIPVVMYSEEMKAAGEETECIICLSEFEIGEKIRVLEDCKHVFHADCVQKWLLLHSSCPTCRANCSSESSSQ